MPFSNLTCLIDAGMFRIVPDVAVLGAHGLGNALPLPTSAEISVSDNEEIDRSRCYKRPMTEPAENGPAIGAALESPI